MNQWPVSGAVKASTESGNRRIPVAAATGNTRDIYVSWLAPMSLDFALP